MNFAAYLRGDKPELPKGRLRRIIDVQDNHHDWGEMSNNEKRKHSEEVHLQALGNDILCASQIADRLIDLGRNASAAQVLKQLKRMAERGLVEPLPKKVKMDHACQPVTVWRKL